jgi:methylated-DNA-protein-cysteine methyltransferase-like protein
VELVIEALGSAVVQLIVGAASAAAGATVTHWLEHRKRKLLEERQSKLEGEIVEVANRSDINEQQVGWTWPQLVEILSQHVPPGKVTTYSLVSLRPYRRVLNHPVGALLKGAGNHGHQVLTNRVVKQDGSLAELPEGAEQQRKQLVSEGVPFTPDGRVDWTRINPVVLI